VNHNHTVELPDSVVIAWREMQEVSKKLTPRVSLILYKGLLRRAKLFDRHPILKAYSTDPLKDSLYVPTLSFSQIIKQAFRFVCLSLFSGFLLFFANMQPEKSFSLSKGFALYKKWNDVYTVVSKKVSFTSSFLSVYSLFDREYDFILFYFDSYVKPSFLLFLLFSLFFFSHPVDSVVRPSLLRIQFRFSSRQSNCFHRCQDRSFESTTERCKTRAAHSKHRAWRYSHLTSGCFREECRGMWKKVD
jgi:hypothetical protein